MSLEHAAPILIPENVAPVPASPTTLGIAVLFLCLGIGLFWAPPYFRGGWSAAFRWMLRWMYCSCASLALINAVVAWRAREEWCTAAVAVWRASLEHGGDEIGVWSRLLILGMTVGTTWLSICLVRFGIATARWGLRRFRGVPG